MKLDFLRPLLRPGPWASVYLDTSYLAEDVVRRQQLQAREADDRLAASGADEATRQALAEALPGLSRDTAGHAVFAANGRVVLDVPLSAAPPSPPLSHWAPLPRLGPLFDHGGPDPACLVAYVDRRGADLELLGIRRHPEPAGEVTGKEWPMHRTARAQWSERHFQLAVENTWEENAARIAETVATDAEEAHAELVVLAGDPRERREVRERLPEQVRARTVESEHGGRAAGSDNRRLAAEVETARAERARAVADEAMDRFREGREPGHGAIEAAEGVPTLVEAAREHRIGALLVRPGGADLRRDVWVGREPDQLAVRRTESRYLGASEPVAARADDALLRSAVANDAEAVALPEQPADPGRLPVGGLGALLRWPFAGPVPGGGYRTGPQFP
ncbi:Vms1/Ankzf1 family peptidyl-tRNA hydrolase [Streptomyces hoynatensis]|uniref:Peptide chain release factor 1 n=1 Tax=Streptomyces hoynatensis TaxID=1141874 RepID=A0A3A9YYY6_9ACTN|nr:Vms1/Ankzf1 family peptidyl-tRNA hydrolase [Streptomyces hoynatensis]RKN41258.1 hypothetical protein D7294_16150 [Streptomyces hoynatensis]